MGRKMRLVIRMAMKIGSPPPRGRAFRAVALADIFCFSMGSSSHLLEIKKFLTKGVKKREIRKEIRIERRKFKIM